MEHISTFNSLVTNLVLVVLLLDKLVNLTLSSVVTWVSVLKSGLLESSLARLVK